MKETKYAVIYPVLAGHARRIFGGKSVFCKYVGRGVPSIGQGGKLLLYVSHSAFEIVGEGKIMKLEFLPPTEIIEKYGRRLFLSRKELEDYRGTRPPDRKLLVAELSQVREFSVPIRRQRPLTMAGKTLTREQYESLIHEARSSS